MPDDRRSDLLQTIFYESTRAGLDPSLVIALIDVASAFRQYAISTSGARGYMQVAPKWQNKIGSSSDNLFHLGPNIRYGCALLRYYLDRANGDVKKALASYADGNKLHPAVAEDMEPVEFSNAVDRAHKRWFEITVMQ